MGTGSFTTCNDVFSRDRKEFSNRREEIEIIYHDIPGYSKSSEVINDLRYIWTISCFIFCGYIIS